jgi:hypothetical protein
MRLLQSALCLLLTVGLACAQGANLLPNGNLAKTTAVKELTGNIASDIAGFTKAGSTLLGDRIPDGWTFQSHEGTPGIGLDATVKHLPTDAFTLKMSNATTKNIGVLRLVGTVPLKPRTRYLFSYYVKGEQVVTDERKGGALGLVATRSTAPGSKDTVLWVPQSLTGTFGWQRVEFAFVTGEDEVQLTSAQVQLRFSSGTAWYADLSLVESQNLITNGGFEGWGPVAPSKRTPTALDGAPLGWWIDKEALETGATPDFEIKATVARDAKIKHGGECAVRMTSELTTDIVSLVFPPVPVKANTAYMVRCWLKGENIVRNPVNSVGVGVWLSTGPAKDFWAHQAHIVKSPTPNTGTFDWTRYEFRLETPATAEMLKFTVQMRRASGTVWVDDVEIVPVAQ